MPGAPPSPPSLPERAAALAAQRAVLMESLGLDGLAGRVKRVTGEVRQLGRVVVAKRGRSAAAPLLRRRLTCVKGCRDRPEFGPPGCRATRCVNHMAIGMVRSVSGGEAEERRGGRPAPLRPPPPPPPRRCAPLLPRKVAPPAGGGSGRGTALSLVATRRRQARHR